MFTMELQEEKGSFVLLLLFSVKLLTNVFDAELSSNELFSSCWQYLFVFELLAMFIRLIC